MLEIGIIHCGGTIGSVVHNNIRMGSYIDVSDTVSITTDAVRIFTKNNNIKIREVNPIQKVSENFNHSDWILLANAIEEYRLLGVDKIIVTHGTDTIHYSAAFIDTFFGKSDVHICFLGAFYPADHSKSDSEINTINCMALILSEGIKTGVYIYSGGVEEKCLISAIDIKPAEYDVSSFSSLYNMSCARVTSRGVEINTDYCDRRSGLDFNIEASNISECKGECDDVFFLQCHPGVTLDHLRGVALRKPIVVVLSMYHAGTAPSISRGYGIAEFIDEFPRCLILLGAYASKVVNHPYSSTASLMLKGGRVYKDILPHYLYALAVAVRLSGQGHRTLLDGMEKYLLHPT